MKYLLEEPWVVSKPWNGFGCFILDKTRASACVESYLGLYGEVPHEYGDIYKTGHWEFLIVASAEADSIQLLMGKYIFYQNW